MSNDTAQVVLPYIAKKSRGALLKMEKTTERRRSRIQGECGWSDEGLFRIQQACPFHCLYRVCHRWEPSLTLARVRLSFRNLTSILCSTGKGDKWATLLVTDGRYAFTTNFGHKPEGTSPEVDGTSSVTDDVFTTAWSGKLSRELCGMAEARGETAMSTVSSDEMSWIDKQVRHSTVGSGWNHLTEQPRLVST